MSNSPGFRGGAITPAIPKILNLSALFRGAAPADEPGRTCSLVSAFEFDGLKPQQERRKSVRRDFGLADDDSSRSDYSRSITKLSGKLLAFGVAGL